MRATIKDVAREAGVSVSTVSYALSRKGQAVKESHRRVIEAAERLGYVPDAKARGLVQGRTNSIGLILPRSDRYTDLDIYDPFFAGVISIYSEEMAKHGCWLSLYLANRDDPSLKDYLVGSGVDGFIAYYMHPKWAEIAHRRGLPFVSVHPNADPENENADTLLDERGSIREAFKYLMELGHRKILCVYGLETDSRKSLYEQILANNGLDYRMFIGANYDEATAYERMKEFLASGAERPTAVIASTDYMAIGVMRAIQHAGLSVPGDISVFGHDDILFARSANPPLTTIRQDIRAAARVAVDYICKFRDDKNMDDQLHLVVQNKLILRESVAPPKSK